MKVYILTCDIEYETSTILGVFSTEEKAEEAKRKEEPSHVGYHGDCLIITDYDVD